MDVRRLPQPIERMPPSPKHLPILRDSPAKRLSNTMLSYQPCRSITQRGQQSKSSHPGAPGALMAVGCSGGSSSPEDMALTVSRTQRRSALRRRIVDSDEDGDATAICANTPLFSPKPCSISPCGQGASALPLAERVPLPLAERALQNLTNRALFSPANPTASSNSAVAAPSPSANSSAQQRHGIGKPGILELATLLKSGNAAGSCAGAGNTTPASVTSTGPAPPGCERIDIDGADGAESPLVLARSVRAPRTGRRVILCDDSDSDVAGSPRPRTAGPPQGPQQGRLKPCEAHLHGSGSSPAPGGAPEQKGQHGNEEASPCCGRNLREGSGGGPLLLPEDSVRARPADLTALTPVAEGLLLPGFHSRSHSYSSERSSSTPSFRTACSASDNGNNNDNDDGSNGSNGSNGRDSAHEVGGEVGEEVGFCALPGGGLRDGAIEEEDSLVCRHLFRLQSHPSAGMPPAGGLTTRIADSWVMATDPRRSSSADGAAVAVASGSYPTSADLRDCPRALGEIEASGSAMEAHSSSGIGSEATAPAAAVMVVGEALPGASQLAKVPRRRQGHRDGRDVAGEAAAAMLLAGTAPSAGAAPTTVVTSSAIDGGCRGVTLANGATTGSDPGGLMYDLYGELQLLSQLQGLSLAADVGDPVGSVDGDGNGDDEGHRVLAGAIDREELPLDAAPLSAAASSPPPLHMLLPSPRTGAVGAAVGAEVVDLTFLSSSTTTPALATSAATRGGSGSDDSYGEQPDGVGRCSPAGLLEAYHQAQPGATRGAAPATPLSIVDMSAVNALCWKRPPTTGRRRAVVLETSSSEASSPQPQHQLQPQPLKNWMAESSSSAAGATATRPQPADHHAGAGKETCRGVAGVDLADPPFVDDAAAAVADVLTALALTDAHEGSRPRHRPTSEELPKPQPTTPYRPHDVLPDGDPYTFSSSSSEGEDDDGSIGRGMRDCALQTPLPWLAPGNDGARSHTGGKGILDGASSRALREAERPLPPSFLLLPLSLRAPGGWGNLDGGCSALKATPAAAETGATMAMATPGIGSKGARDGCGGGGGKEAAAPAQQVPPRPDRRPADGTAGRAPGRARTGRTGRTSAAAAEQRAFLAVRARVAQELYDSWNEGVFDGQLPGDLPLVWNSRLASTAGQVVAERELPGTSRRVAAKLELSPRLIDSLVKLRNTLAHEMCHVAAWHLSLEFNRPHGPAWESWARKFTRHDPSLVIRRTHDYITQYAHRWRCTKEGCGKEYGRQRRTIRVGVHVCAVCHSQLKYLGHFDKYGNLKAPKAAGTAAAAAGGATAAADVRASGTGTAAKPLSEFAQFCKENFRSVKTSMPARTPASAVMKHMGLLYQKQKANITLTASAAAGVVGIGVGGGGDGGGGGSTSNLLSAGGRGGPLAYHAVPFLLPSPPGRSGGSGSGTHGSWRGSGSGTRNSSGGRRRRVVEIGSGSPSRHSIERFDRAECDGGMLLTRLMGVSLADESREEETEGSAAVVVEKELLGVAVSSLRGP